MAELYFENLDENEKISLERESYNFSTSQKGTVLHDRLEGNRADPFIGGAEIVIKINCREDAYGLKKDQIIQYGLAVTLEIPEDNTINIYEEIKERIKSRQSIRPIPN